MSRKPIGGPKKVNSFSTGTNAGSGWHRGFHACNQTCGIPGCNTGVVKSRFLCFDHFKRLSPSLKNQVSRMYQPWNWGGKPPSEWVGLARKVTAFLIAREMEPVGEIVCDWK